MKGMGSMIMGRWRVGTRVPREQTTDRTSMKIATYGEPLVTIHGGGGNYTRVPDFASYYTAY
jgi:hypothetical protein